MVNIQFSIENAAFSENQNFEIARILRALADDIENEVVINHGLLRDLNGNVIGSYECNTCIVCGCEISKEDTIDYGHGLAHQACAIADYEDYDDVDESNYNPYTGCDEYEVDSIDEW
jgi:hypothetical protein